MEYVEGGAIIVLGLVIVLFGSAKTSDGVAVSRLALPGWLDDLLKWTIGLLCIWFGVALLRGHSHFF